MTTHSKPESESEVRWQRVNEEPFEYAIQQGPHGDEFVKLLNGSCLRRSIPAQRSQPIIRGILTNPKWERFAQEIANGKILIVAHQQAGYKPDVGSACKLKQKPIISSRINEIAQERAAIHAQGVTRAIESTALSKEWVIRTLIQNVERAMQAQEVVLRDGTGTGQYVYNGHVANKALELLGREIGMFIERHEVGGAGEFARLNDEELLTRALNDAKAMGAGPKQLAAIRAMFEPQKLIEGEVTKKDGESD